MRRLVGVRATPVLLHTKQSHNALGCLKECECVDASVCDGNVREGLGRFKYVTGFDIELHSHLHGLEEWGHLDRCRWMRAGESLLARGCKGEIRRSPR